VWAGREYEMSNGGWDGILYAVGYYQGKRRGSYYDGVARGQKSKKTAAQRVRDVIVWSILWGFFVIAS
jgi:hypothetical protein